MFYARVSAAIEQAQRSLAERDTSRLRAQSLRTGWSEKAAQHLVVHADKGALWADFTGAEEYELGTAERPPLAVARSYNLRPHDDDLFAEVSARLQGLL